MNKHLRGTEFICNRTRMLDYLMDLGFKPTSRRHDITNTDYYVWCFTITPELEEAVGKYLHWGEEESK